MKMERREALKWGLAAAVGSALPSSLRAETPAPSAATTGSDFFFKSKVGDFEIVSLYDGTGTAKDFHPMWAPEAKKEEVTAALQKNFLPTDKLVMAFNALVVRTGKEVVLLDSGNGAKARPNLGKVEAALLASGIKPEDVTTIFLSHAHGDHMGGLLKADGTLAFPKAQIFTAQAEADFWLSKAPDLSRSALPAEAKKGMTAGAQQVLETIKPTKLADGATLVPGLTISASPGHTPGHSTVRISSGSEELLFLADTAHHPAIMFTNPDWTVAFDANPRQAAATRKKTFAQVTAQRTRVHLFHMPFPGIGHIRKGEGVSYEWVPEPWNLSQA